jgi:hypothetical protein
MIGPGQAVTHCERIDARYDTDERWDQARRGLKHRITFDHA